MASVVQICNMALLAIGSDLITSLTEKSEPAAACAVAWDNARDAVLRDYPWHCAMDYATLARGVTSPGMGFAYAYAMPTNPYCLRVLNLKEEADGFAWRVRGRFIETDAETATIEYIKRVTDPNVFDALLVKALASRLAAEIAFKLTGSSALVQAQYQLYGGLLAEARLMDAREGGESSTRESSWVTVRY